MLLLNLLFRQQPLQAPPSLQHLHLIAKKNLRITMTAMIVEIQITNAISVTSGIAALLFTKQSSHLTRPAPNTASP
jgi:hypothetical protein